MASHNDLLTTGTLKLALLDLGVGGNAHNLCPLPGKFAGLWPASSNPVEFATPALNSEPLDFREKVTESTLFPERYSAGGYKPPTTVSMASDQKMSREFCPPAGCYSPVKPRRCHGLRG